MRHAGLARNFEWVLRTLAARGHRVHVGLEERWGDHDAELVAQLTNGSEAISFGRVPVRGDRWAEIAFELRRSASYLRYLEPEYGNAPKLRARAGRRTPKSFVRLTRKPVVRSRLGRCAMAGIVRGLDAAMPTAAEVDAFLDREAFDLLVTTPLVTHPSQVEWLRSAKPRGIPAAFAVANWDNLSSKGLVFEIPDRTYVWNEVQREEAVRYHGIPADKVAVVGAHGFDHWFTWTPSSSRTEFCSRLGLDPEQPFLLYVCSSNPIAEVESEVVVRWLEKIRAHDDLRNLGVLVRPHPKNSAWVENPLAEVPNTAVWPPVGADPLRKQRREDYYDSLYHSAVVVGLNTTALIEAAIVGRRTFSFVAPEAHGGQEGTVHFHYLARDNGGALTLARSLDEHVEQLADGLRKDDADAAAATRRFVEKFVRPHGLDVAAAPCFVDDLEAFVAGFEASRVRRRHRLRRMVLAGMEWERRASRSLHKTRKRAPKVLKRRARRWVRAQASRVRRARRVASARR
jgi:hypothetical protein